MPAWYDAGLVASLADLPLGTRRVPAGVAEGRHPSRLPGAGLEFAQYRGYQPGDDVRRIDWKLLARSDRFFVREADAETALPIILILDATASMGHTEAGIRKFDVARAILAALASGAIKHGDVPGLVILGGENRSVSPSRDHRQYERIVDSLDRVEPTGTLPSEAVDQVTALGLNGPCVIVSDGHDPGDGLLAAATAISMDTTILALRAPREEDLDYGRAVTLQDLESGARLTVTPEMRHNRKTADRAWRERAKQLSIAVETIDPTRSVITPLRSWLAVRSGRR